MAIGCVSASDPACSAKPSRSLRLREFTALGLALHKLGRLKKIHHLVLRFRHLEPHPEVRDHPLSRYVASIPSPPTPKDCPFAKRSESHRPRTHFGISPQPPATNTAVTAIMSGGKPRGLNAARKLRTNRREQRWSDLAYKKRALGTAFKSRCAPSSTRNNSTPTRYRSDERGEE